jgi:Tol biopolymer transport system component
MGEVFRARDTKLNRDVAIKVLLPAVANDPDRLARFSREAQVLASLNHPNIAHIHGLEESDGIRALVMELVEGPTLAETLEGLKAQGVGLDKSLAIAKQIAEALDAAHERGIVHRDLKPANIMITPDNIVKVLDFGLARVANDSTADLTHSPTMIGPTGEGMLLGTAPYMSPEQARGKPVDKRADIWAFGCVLYEMLTGRRAFIGETTTDVLAKIVEREPDWTALAVATPPHIVRLLKRCLEKDPRLRLRDIGDARFALDDDVTVASPAGQKAAALRMGVWRVVAIVVLVVAASLLAVVVWLSRGGAPTSPHPVQFIVAAAAGETLEVSPPVPSPDGRRIAFGSRDASGHQALWIRGLDGAALQRIGGSDGATGAPFWSPDGKFVGFVAQGKLKKVDASGGPVLNIATVQTNLGATWGKDNVIVLAPVNRTVLHRVSASGGTPEAITTLNASRKENSHRWPHFLPDGRHFLFTARSDVKENNIIYVGSLDSKEMKPLITAQSNAVYAAPGYLLFAQEGTLMAQRFDARALTLSGDPVPVAANIGHTTPSSVAMFSASADGRVLSYQPAVPRLARISWFDRAGHASEPIGPEKEFTELRLSPNGAMATVVIPDPDSGNRDIWLLDLGSGNLTRLTSNPANDWQVAWSPDSRRIAFASDRNGRSSIYSKSIDSGEETLLFQMPKQGAFPKGWSSDGRFLSMGVDGPDGTSHIWALPLAGDRKPFSLSQSSAREDSAVLSPDGQWIAYESDESGSTEIYVRPFARPGKVRLSDAGGAQPRWRRDGREVFYVAGNRDMSSVAVTSVQGGATISAASPKPLFPTCADASTGTQVVVRPRATYDATADGTRFLLACGGPDANKPSIMVSVDWTASLK